MWIPKLSIVKIDDHDPGGGWILSNFSVRISSVLINIFLERWACFLNLNKIICAGGKQGSWGYSLRSMHSQSMHVLWEVSSDSITLDIKSSTKWQKGNVESVWWLWDSVAYIKSLNLELEGTLDVENTLLQGRISLVINGNGFKSWLCYLLPQWPWASLSLGVLISKMTWNGLLYVH